MKLRIAMFAVVFLLLSCAAVTLQAAPVFYISTSPTPTAPALLNLDVEPNSTGTLNIFASSDIRLNGVSLDLVETGDAINFTGATVLNPDNRWAFIATPDVSGSTVARIDGGALPGVVGNGIGAGSPEGADVLFASVNYTATGSGTSQLSLKVGGNIIAEWAGAIPDVHFGTAASPAVSGGIPGNGGSVGSIHIMSGDSEPLVVDTDLGLRTPGELITHMFQSLGVPPITWTNLAVMGPSGAIPVLEPTLTGEGAFSWDSTNSALGTWTFNATATNAFGTDIGTLTFDLGEEVPIPEPTTLWILGPLLFSSLALYRKR